MSALRATLRPLASLRLTVALLGLSMFLIFAGTLAQATQGVWQVIDAYFRSPVAWIDLQLFVPRDIVETGLRLPFPGGYTLAGLLIVNLIAAHLVRFKLSRRRVGIVVLHAGLILLLASEFVTGLSADEGLMSIDEGASANFVEDAREVELALVDATDPQWDEVVAVPQSVLVRAARTGKAISHDALPATILVEQWMPNSRLRRNDDNPSGATRGIGVGVEVQELPRVSGVDMGAVDAPAALVTLSREGEPLGTWLVSVNLAPEQVVEIDGREHRIALRFQRSYKPYTLHLIDFRHDRFVGTTIPRNFSSHLRLVDPSRDTDREVLISMNNPLRHAGEAFYQSSYKPDNTGTVLQVVRNPGWLLPYIACALVSAGLVVHFLVRMTEFLRRQRTREKKALSPALARTGGGAAIPLIACAGAMCLALLPALRGSGGNGGDGSYDLRAFGSLPVSADGRVKPMDTVARTAVMLASGRRSATLDGQRVPATRFLLDLAANPEDAQRYEIVRVDHPGVLALLDRAPEEAGRLTLAEIEPHWHKVAEQAQRAADVDARRRDPFQRAVLALHSRVNHLLALARMEAPYSIAPLAPGEQWRPFNEALLDSPLHSRMAHGEETDEPVHPSLAYFISMMTAHHEGDAGAFNIAVRQYRTLLQHRIPDASRRAGVELWFNRTAPFLGAAVGYVLAFLTLCGSFLLRARNGGDGRGVLAERVRRAGVGFLLGAAIVHTLGLALRVYLQGRPPVTNLYSSAVFVGWASVLVGMMLERLSRLGLAGACSAVVGFATLIVAHNLDGGGDTMQMMQAVLDSNFWLATHVITITLGYSATFLAGAMALAFLALGLFTRQLTRERARAMASMVYGVVCFALLLSFVGTVLGGIWADQSWGRFWGWDPKENGAALVVLLNAIILHARWGGMIRERGLMLLAIGGNIVTAWSWFGTNMLGVGLHSYGFMDSAVFWLLAFVASQFACVALGLLPLRYWRSGAHFERRSR